MRSIRDQVRARIMKTMEEAVAAGLDAIREARKAYPDVPAGLLGELWASLEVNETEHWWRSMEKTIDGEVLNRAAGQITDGHYDSRVAGDDFSATESVWVPDPTPGPQPDIGEMPDLDFGPAPERGGADRLPLRDRIALAAVPELQKRCFALQDRGEGLDDDQLATQAYGLADAMLAVRGR